MSAREPREIDIRRTRRVLMEKAQAGQQSIEVVLEALRADRRGTQTLLPSIDAARGHLNDLRSLVLVTRDVTHG